MGIYSPSQDYIDRELAKASPEERAGKRLQMDLAHILTGPTSAYNAERLAQQFYPNHLGLARAMKEAAERYLDSVKEK